MFDQEDLVLISALNHYSYCPRRCALIHVEGIFVQNAFTLEGTLSHERVDDPSQQVREGIRIVRALPLYSRRLGLVGKADVVEFSSSEGNAPYPVDYKHGPRREWDNDDVQVCAQALCLEEMLGAQCPKGAVYHIASKKRREILFDQDLRNRTMQTIQEVRDLLRSRTVPSPVFHPKCEGCSLKGACLPDVASDSRGFRRLMGELFRSGEVV